MYDEDCKKKKMCMGLSLLIFGIVWYMNSIGAVTLEPFWPIVAMVAGLVLVARTFVMCPMEKKRR